MDHQNGRELPPRMAEMATDLSQMPPAALLEFPSIDAKIETCILGSGHPGLRLVFWPSTFPLLKISVPFVAPALRRFAEQLLNAVEQFEETREGEKA